MIEAIIMDQRQAYAAITESASSLDECKHMRCVECVCVRTYLVYISLGSALPFFVVLLASFYQGVSGAILEALGAIPEALGAII